MIVVNILNTSYICSAVVNVFYSAMFYDA